MDSVLRDLRYALRTLGRSPAFTAAAVLALALGIGGSSAIFSVLHGVVLRPLAAPQPEQLVRVHEALSDGGRSPFSVLDYLDLAKENGSFESMAAVQGSRLAMTTDGGPIQLITSRVTASFFATLKVHPVLGRGFTPEEDRGANHVVILSDQLWRREFSGDRRVLNQTVTLDGTPYTVIGVMPPGFRFPLLRDAEALVPFQWDERALQARGMHMVHVFGRMKPGASLQQVKADLDVLGPRIASRLPDHTGMTMRGVPLLDDLVGPVKPVLQALLGAVVMVLLIACANVASMLLARGAARQRELAIRAALGSGRRRLVTQLLTEAILLGVAGGALGILLATWGVELLVGLAPRSIPRMDEVRLDGSVVAFATLISLASGLIAGLVPALQASQPDLVDALKNGAAGATHRGRARSALVVAEVALALVLVVGAGLMIRTLRRLLDVPTGMTDPAHVLLADLDLPRDRYKKDGDVLAFERQLAPRIAALPGVKSVAFTTTVPLDIRFQAALAFNIVGDPPPPPGQAPDAEVVWASPEYLASFGIPLLRGRFIEPRDVEGAPRVIVVNEAFVRKLLKGRDAVGMRINNFRGENDPGWEIVGVVADVHTRALDRAPEPQIIVPYAQWTQWIHRIAVRTTSSRPLDLIPLIRAEVQSIDKDQPIAHAMTLEQVISDSIGQRRFQMTLLSMFAIVALVLAALGIYGVMAYTVAQRSREIGIRMALGAQASEVLRMVVAGGMKLAVLGVGIGVLGALAVTQALKAALYDVSATDPLTFGAVCALLLGVALVASWAPARRATRVDPMVPLRAE